ncbi:YggT family protein [Maritalea sp.]|uniref:YggT family protein n=1 Tax=Maritalea sp. TaxID=2003361 RepID=UPI003EF7FBD7
MLLAIIQTLLMVLGLVRWVVIIMIIMSWLFSFNIINGTNQFVAMIWRLVDGLTAPLLKPIRRFVPNIGGLDISPIVLFVIIFFLESLLRSWANGIYF